MQFLHCIYFFICCCVAFMCPEKVEQQRRQQTDVKYHLLQIIHTFHSRRQLVQVQSWTCLQIRVRARSSCQSWFRSLSSHTLWNMSSFIYYIPSYVLPQWQCDMPSCKQAARQSGGLVKESKCTWRHDAVNFTWTFKGSMKCEKSNCFA